jgi:hypothetical protein
MRIIMAKLLWHFDILDFGVNKDWMDQKVFITWEKNDLPVSVSIRGKDANWAE